MGRLRHAIDCFLYLFRNRVRARPRARPAASFNERAKSARKRMDKTLFGRISKVLIEKSASDDKYEYRRGCRKGVLCVNGILTAEVARAPRKGVVITFHAKCGSLIMHGINSVNDFAEELKKQTGYDI